MKQKKYFVVIQFWLLLSSCRSEIEVIKLNLEKHNSDFLVDYYVVNNPPKDLNGIITFINHNLDTIIDQQKLNTGESKFYLIEFYEESFFFNRNYQPHYKWYDPYNYDDIRDGQSHLDNKYITVILKNARDDCNSCSKMPIYMLHSKKLNYYPNGFRNNSNKHWERMKD